MGCKEIIHQRSISYIPFNEAVVRLVGYINDIGEIACIGKFIKVDDVIVRIATYQTTYYMRTYETGTTGDKNTFLKFHSDKSY